MRLQTFTNDQYGIRLFRALATVAFVIVTLVSGKVLLSSKSADSPLRQAATEPSPAQTMSFDATQSACPEQTEETIGTPTPMPSGEWYVTAIYGVDVLECPSADFAVIASVDFNEVLEVIDTANGWHRILLAEGRTGYVPEIFVFFIADEIFSPPSPTAIPSPNETPRPTLPACSLRTDWPVYIVQAGDTLSRLATRVGRTVAQLVRANCLPDPDSIFSGQRLHLPFIPPTSIVPSPPPPTNMPTHTPTSIVPSPPFPNATDTPTPTGTVTVRPSAPNLVIIPPSAALGTTHTLTFTALPPNQRVTVTVLAVSTGQVALTQSASIDQAGNGSTSFTTSANTFTTGNYIIRITGTTGFILQSNFEVQAP